MCVCMYVLYVLIGRIMLQDRGIGPVYVCMYVCMYVCDVDVYRPSYAPRPRSVYVCMYVCLYVCIEIH